MTTFRRTFLSAILLGALAAPLAAMPMQHAQLRASIAASMATFGISDAELDALDLSGLGQLRAIASDSMSEGGKIARARSVVEQAR